MITSKTVGFTLAALALAAPLAAAEVRHSELRELRAAREKVARAADSTKGGPRQLLLQERQRIDALIDDLETGRPVRPEDIDRSLRAAERGTP